MNPPSRHRVWHSEGSSPTASDRPRARSIAASAGAETTPAPQTEDITGPADWLDLLRTPARRAASPLLPPPGYSPFVGAESAGPHVDSDLRARSPVGGSLGRDHPPAPRALRTRREHDENDHAEQLRRLFPRGHLYAGRADAHRVRASGRRARDTEHLPGRDGA